ISDAFRDAELLADAVDAGLSGRQLMAEALAGYQRRRDAQSAAAYQATIQAAAHEQMAPDTLALLRAIAANPAETRRFLGVSFGALPPEEVFAPDSIARIMAGAEVAVGDAR